MIKGALLINAPYNFINDLGETMIKLIATDLDGTLLQSNHQLPLDFDHIMEQLKQEKIIFAAASGRPFLTLRETFKGYEEEMLFIADNGAHIVYQGQTLATYEITPKTVEAFVHKVRTLPHTCAVLCTTEGAFLETSEPAFLEEVKKYYVKYTIVPDLTQVKVPAIKLTVCDLLGAETHCAPYFASFKTTLQVCVAGKVWLDMMPLGVNKGQALAMIQEKLGITAQEMMAFGDYLNDVEMLRHVYYSYAMANAHPALFQVARFKALSNDENGVMVAIREMLVQQHT